MSITYEKNRALFESVIYEDEVISLRDFLQESAGEAVEFDFTKCEDIHLAILQLIMAYKKSYESIYKFSDDKKLFEIVLKGFDTSENYCS